MEIAISLMGGLGLFLYGMNLMGEALEKSAGTRLKKIIELLTSNIIMGVLVGALVTAVIQSYGSWFCKCRYNDIASSCRSYNGC